MELALTRSRFEYLFFLEPKEPTANAAAIATLLATPLAGYLEEILPDTERSRLLTFQNYAAHPLCEWPRNPAWNSASRLRPNEPVVTSIALIDSATLFLDDLANTGNVLPFWLPVLAGIH